MVVAKLRQVSMYIRKIKIGLQSIVEWALSMYGIKIGGVKMNSKMCPRRKSDDHKDISTILTTNSRAGWDMTWDPSPRPYHLPVHQALLVSSCLNSRERKTEIKILLIARWMKTTAITPRTAREASQRSKYHYNEGQGAVAVVFNYKTYHEFQKRDQADECTSVSNSSNE